MLQNRLFFLLFFFHRLVPIYTRALKHIPSPSRGEQASTVRRHLHVNQLYAMLINSPAGGVFFKKINEQTSIKFCGHRHQYNGCDA